MNGTDSTYRVMVRVRIPAGMEQKFEKTWQEVASSIARHPSNLAQSLARVPAEEGIYYIVSDWVSEERFREFEKSPEHAVNRTRLDAYRDCGHSSMTGMVVTSQVAPEPTAGRVRVVVNLAEAADPAMVENGYHLTSRDLVGTPGLHGNELLRSLRNPRKFAVLSEWADAASWSEWEKSAVHDASTAPLRSQLDPENGATFDVYEVVAAY